MQSTLTLLQKSLELLVPHSCLLCEQGIMAPTSGSSCPTERLPLCRLCRLELENIPKLGPVSLNRPELHRPDRRPTKPVRWHDCQQHVPGLTRGQIDCTVLWPFSPFAQNFLHRAKFGPSLTLLRCMGEMLGTLLSSLEATSPPCTPENFTLIVPVPASEQYSRTRLFDSTHVIATSLGLLAPVRHLFSRTKMSRPQSSLTRRERIQNARISFELKQKFADRISGQHILLVDDVATTGYSLLVLADQLYAHGAEKVSAALTCLNQSNLN